MPYTGQYYGGTKRFYFSRVAETGQTTANWAEASQTLNGVLNPIDGSDMIGPPFKEILANANSAQGQSEWPDRLYAGPEDHQGNPRFWLTPEAIGKFAASAFGADAKTTVDTTGYQHAITLTTAPVAFTIEEHLQGAATATNSWHFLGCWVKAFTVEVAAGNQYATITPHIVASKLSSAGSDQTALDVPANWPAIPGLAPMKIGLWLAPTTGNNHTSALGAFSDPSAAGTPFEDLTGEIDFGIRARSFSFTYDTGVDLNQLYQPGSASTAGYIRGKPYAVGGRLCSLTMNFDVDSSTDNLLSHFQDWADATPLSWSMQMTGVSDDLVGAVNLYSGFTIGVHAMRVTQLVRPDTGLGPMTASVTLEGMQAASSAAYALIHTWDDVNVDYA